jgi:nucleoside-diphosphate-sugar epimerase
MADAQVNKALVLGASGGVGGEMARQLRDTGWQVSALKRGLSGPVKITDGITWLAGDAMNAADVQAAAQGVSVIVHAVNPPGYQRWGELVLPMVDNTIAAAIAQRATIVLPGTVYNFGPDAGCVLEENSPQHPLTKKGTIRVRMEQRLHAATAQGARVLIVRAGDFFGPGAANNWFSQCLVKPGAPVRRILNPARRGIGHQWNYLPDVARTMVQLLQQRTHLPAFARFHLAGHWDADGMQMARAVQAVVARRTGLTPRITPFPWPLLPLAAPFVPFVREMLEMRYLWRVPLRMDNTRLIQTLGQEPHTPLETAVERTLEAMGVFAGTPSAATSGLFAVTGKRLHD